LGKVNKVMVTGSGGFIGSAVVQELQSRGIEVVPFNLPDHDICHSADVERTLRGCDGVIHLAGVLGTHELFDTPHTAVDVNIHGSLNVLDACRLHEAFYVGITMPQVFPSIYTSTKVATTKLASAYAHTHGLRVAHVRAFNAFGPGQAHGPGHPQKILPTFAYNATHGIPLPIWGDGQQGVDLIYTPDLARILVDAAVHVATYGVRSLNDLTFDGGTGKMFTVNQVARMVHDIANGPNTPMLVEYHPMRRGEVPTDIVATGENWDVLGYRKLPVQGDYTPEFRMKDLQDTVEYYRNYLIH
jgi:UDP-glucose 4-epimerase